MIHRSSNRISLSIGEFIASCDGVVAKCKARLGGVGCRYGWDSLPLGVAAIKSLVDAYDYELVERVIRYFKVNDTELDGLSKIRAAPVLAELHVLIDWAQRQAKLNNRPDVARSLSRMQNMGERELDQFTSKLLEEYWTRPL